MVEGQHARALLEARPDFVAVKLDLRNAINEVKRSAVLEASKPCWLHLLSVA